MQKKVVWPVVTIAAALSSLGMTAAFTSLLHVFFERPFATPGVGLPYEVCVASLGIAFSAFILYCGFLLATSWSNRRFGQAIQVFLSVCVAVSVISTAWFFFASGHGGLINVLGVLFACLLAAPGVGVARQVAR